MRSTPKWKALERFSPKVDDRAGVEVAHTLLFYIHRGVRMPTGDRLESLASGRSQGVVSHVLVQNAIEKIPFFGVFGHVHPAETQFGAKLVQKFERLFEKPVPRHDSIEIVPVHDQQATLDFPAFRKANAARIIENQTGIVVAINPDQGSLMGFAHQALQHGLVGAAKSVSRIIDGIAIED